MPSFFFNPLIMNKTEKKRKSESKDGEWKTHTGGTHTHRHTQEPYAERCKMEGITNECAAEKEP